MDGRRCNNTGSLRSERGLGCLCVCEGEKEEDFQSSSSAVPPIHGGVALAPPCLAFSHRVPAAHASSTQQQWQTRILRLTDFWSHYVAALHYTLHCAISLLSSLFSWHLNKYSPFQQCSFWDEGLHRLPSLGSASPLV
jgi:hypothetical protein